jgi:2-(1,2-epoxy-1,2-dihydrophenyl)acetyl-CoA isomerase
MTSREVQVSDTVLVSTADSVATITLNRPDALNSLTVELKEALLDVVRQVAADPAVRAVVLTGAGRGFCAGQDLREHAESLAAGDPAPLHTVERHFNPLCLALATMPKPVVAAVNGMAAGAGASISFTADFRIAADSAKFLLAFANVGLALDTGASWTLPRLIGHARATALALLAEPVSASAALEMGLVNAVVPDDGLAAAAHELAARLAAGPTLAYAAIKEQLLFAAGHPLGAALEKENEVQSRLGGSADHRNATRAFTGKERPVYEGR